MRSVLFTILTTAVLVCATPARSQGALPAVDGLSGKLRLSGATADGDNSSGVEGAITFPLAHRFGMQLDLGAGRLETPYDGYAAYQGAGAHLFWRDPSKGMIGIETSYAHLNAYDGVHTYSAGLEAERYWDRFTLAGVMGVTGGAIRRCRIPRTVFATISRRNPTPSRGRPTYCQSELSWTFGGPRLHTTRD